MGVMGLIGGSVLMGVVGSKMPHGTGSTLVRASVASSKFVKPAVGVRGAGIVMKQFKHFPKPKKKWN